MDVDPIGDDEWLTQLGSTNRKAAKAAPFRFRPTIGTSGMSLIRRACTVTKAVELVRGPLTRDAPERHVRAGDAVRRVLAGALRAAGFVVDHDPLDTNPDHVLVKFPGRWDDRVGDAFDGAFDDEVIQVTGVDEGLSA